MAHFCKKTDGKDISEKLIYTLQILSFSNLTVDKQNVKKFKSLNTIITDGESVSWGH